MRVAGLDVGTVGTDLCLLEHGRVLASRSWETAALLAQPSSLEDLLDGVSLLVVAAGYGAPLTPLATADAATLTLAILPDPAGTGGGIGGLRRLLTTLAALPCPAMLLPGVLQLPTVPAHRKLNRVDLGTADKVATAALVLATQGVATDAIVLELGGAFTAALALHEGRIVDAVGGSAGPLGMQAAGALDAEVAMLAGQVSKRMLFHGGRRDAESLLGPAGALTAWLEGAAKAVVQLQVTVPTARRVLLAGRGAREAGVPDALQHLLPNAQVEPLLGLPEAGDAKHGAQGAAIVADGLAGGRFADVAERLALRSAAGTVLDHLVVLSPAAARRTLGLS